jgi:hypothetical protein
MYLKSIIGLIFIGLLLLGQVIGADKADTKSVRDDKEAQGSPSEQYYLTHKSEMMEAFGTISLGAFIYLGKSHDNTTAKEICDDSAVLYESLITELPDLGGDENLNIKSFGFAPMVLAFYRPMKARGMSTEEIGNMLYNLFEMSMRYTIRDDLNNSVFIFTQPYQEELKAYDNWTHMRIFKDNWVMTYVPGDRNDFDFGIDYSECAIVNYLRSHDAGDIAPYVCLYDFLKSNATGTGLYRTKTIAQGDNVCNFRYKKGRKVTQSLNTEVSKFNNQSSNSIQKSKVCSNPGSCQGCLSSCLLGQVLASQC